MTDDHRNDKELFELFGVSPLEIEGLQFNPSDRLGDLLVQGNIKQLLCYYFGEWLKVIGISDNMRCDGNILQWTFQIQRMVEAIIRAGVQRKNIYIMGNGGCALIASHMAHNLTWDATADFDDLISMRVFSVPDQTGNTTGISNDRNYDLAYAIYLNRVLQSGDVVIGLSGSGNSLNVNYGLQLAKERESITMAICGLSRTPQKLHLTDISHAIDIILIVPTADQQVAEDVIDSIKHIIGRAIRDFLYMIKYRKLPNVAKPCAQLDKKQESSVNWVLAKQEICEPEIKPAASSHFEL